MASIYELTEEFRTLWALMEDGQLDDDALADAFDTAEGDLAEKLEGYCKFIKNAESDIEGLKAEEHRLGERRKVLENTIARAKEAMQTALTVAGENKIACGSFVVSRQKNPPRLVYDEGYIENSPERYLIPQEPKIDTKAMIADLKDGKNIEELEGVAHLEQGESLRIK